MTSKYSNLVMHNFVGQIGWFDLFLLWPLATPWTAQIFWDLLTWVHIHLGLKGHFPQMDSGTLLFLVIMGTLAVGWAIARILVPAKILGKLDAVLRLYIASLFLGWLIFFGWSTLLCLFVATELCGAGYFYFKTLRN